MFELTKVVLSISWSSYSFLMIDPLFLFLITFEFIQPLSWRYATLHDDRSPLVLVYHANMLYLASGGITWYMLYYGLFWMKSTYLDVRWRSRSTGHIPELLITSIVRHKNNNRWVGDPLWRSCSLFCVVIFHSSFGLVTYPYIPTQNHSHDLRRGCPLHLFLL